MRLERKVVLVKKDLFEIVTETELYDLLNEIAHPRVYVGYEPSGKIHLGHLLTINKLRDLQKAGFQVTVLLADLHANLNKKGTLKEIQATADYNKDCFIGMGIDSKNTDFILGSEMQLDRDYFLNIQRLALNTTLQRARRSMDFVGREEANPTVSRVLYPLMQVIDIVTLNLDVAVGGIDQRKIHMLARDKLTTLGYKPPVCLHLPLIHGLDGDDKMSSSKDNFISVDNTSKEITNKIRKAYCPINKIENNPVLELYQFHIFRNFSNIKIKRPSKFGGDLEYRNYSQLEIDFSKGEIHPEDLKNSASEYISKILSPVNDYLIKKGYNEQ
jgi:tyrosyl-tRNA synthetase|tara:strand:- start:4735 stop:5721 length:987 start_codon:yes stop_codon:yes gene_type:complete